MGVIICIKLRSINRGVFRICEALFLPIVSFGCSSYETDDQKEIKLRPISKAVFAAVFVTFSIYYGLTASPKIFNNSQLENQNSTFDLSSSNCSSLCQGNRTDMEQEILESYCNNLWEDIEPASHLAICVTLGFLFLFSLMECILEYFFDWMPHNMLYAIPLKPGESPGNRNGYNHKGYDDNEL